MVINLRFLSNHFQIVKMNTSNNPTNAIIDDQPTAYQLLSAVTNDTAYANLETIVNNAYWEVHADVQGLECDLQFEEKFEDSSKARIEDFTAQISLGKFEVVMEDLERATDSIQQLIGLKDVREELEYAYRKRHILELASNIFGEPSLDSAFTDASNSIKDDVTDLLRTATDMLDQQTENYSEQRAACIDILKQSVHVINSTMEGLTNLDIPERLRPKRARVDELLNELFTENL